MRLLLVLVVLLGGCSTPQRIAANQDSATFTFTSATQLESAIAEGMAHCTGIGKRGTPAPGYRVGLKYVQVVECR